LLFYLSIRDGNKVRAMRSNFFAYVATHISFCVAICSTCVTTFYNNMFFFLSSVHLKFDIRSMRFEPVIFLNEHKGTGGHVI